MSSASSTNIEQESFLNSLIVFVKGSLIFVVSQAWNSAVQHLIEQNQFFNDYGKVFYAVLITFLSVYVLKLISNLKRLIERCRVSFNGKCRSWARIFDF